MTPGQWIKEKKQVKKNNLAKISNSLIESFVKKNNLGALKILFYISKNDVVYGSDELVTLRFNVKELSSYCNINSRTLYRNIKQMQETSVSFVIDDNYEENITVIPYSKIEYNGFIELKLFKKILTLVSQVKNKFTIIDLENLMKLKSKHSVRMIQLLEMIDSFSENIAKRKTYDLDDLNGMFGTNYKRIKEFERKILVPVKSELDEISYLTFLYQINYDNPLHTRGRPRAISVTIDLVSN